MSLTRESYVAGLRAAADFYEQHIEVPFPLYSAGIANTVVDTKEEAVLVAKALGKCDKVYSDSLLTIKKEVAPGFFLDFLFSRSSVCERVVIGTTTIAAHTKLIPEEVVEDVEWRCLPILADEGGAR